MIKRYFLYAVGSVDVVGTSEKDCDKFADNLSKAELAEHMNINFDGTTELHELKGCDFYVTEEQKRKGWNG